MSGWEVFTIGATGMIVLFALAWGWARKVDNYSLVDVVWAYGLGALAGVWLALGDGDALKRALAAALILTWSFRLSRHLALRVYRAHPEEDSRYAELRGRWQGKVPAMFFGFFQAQAVSVMILALPFLLIGRDRSGFGGWEIAGTGVALLAIGGEALADLQMSVFKRRNTGHSRVCNVGLWRYSRHPNYFFEFLIWVGVYLYACGSAGGWAMIHAPAIILFLLLRVTGVPPSEKSSLASKGAAYRDYQRTTSVFIPLPPRNPPRP